MKRAINDFWYRLQTLQFQSIWFLLRIKQQQKSSSKKISTRNNAPIRTIRLFGICRIVSQPIQLISIASNRFKFSDNTYTQFSASVSVWASHYISMWWTQWAYSMFWFTTMYFTTDTDSRQQQKLHITLLAYSFIFPRSLSLSFCNIADHINKVNIPANRIDLQIIWYIYIIIIENWDLKDSTRIEFDWIYEWKFS